MQTRQTEAGVTVVVPSGRLDVAGAPALKEAIGEAVKNGPPRLVIDMEGVPPFNRRIYEIVRAVNGRQIRTVRDLVGAASAAQGAWQVTIDRGGQQITATFQ